MKTITSILVLAAAAVTRTYAQYNCNTVLKDQGTGKEYYYDLSSLYHSVGKPDEFLYRTKDGNYFYVNFCGTTTTPCEAGSSVCQYASNRVYYGCGQLKTQEMSSLDGVAANKGVKVTYSGGTECSGGKQRRTDIHVLCNKAAVPGYLYDESEEDCEYTLKMYSVAGCGQPVSGQSSSELPFCHTRIVDPADKHAYHYDLTRLNHQTGLPDTLFYIDKYGNYYYVNLCGETTTSCPRGTSVCRRSSADRSFSGYGQVETQRFEALAVPGYRTNEGVTVKYSGGDECTSGPGKRSSKVNVICSPTSDPGYIYDATESNCTAELSVYSAAGCYLPEPHSGSSVIPGFCQAVLRDPTDGKRYKFDLSRLNHPDGVMDNLYFHDSGSGNTFFVNFCGNTYAACTAGSSVCIRTSAMKYYSGGMKATQSFRSLAVPGRLTNEGVTVKYSAGDKTKCPSGKQRTTTINVICQKGADPGYFYESTEDSCDYSLAMYSEAGCPVAIFDDTPATNAFAQWVREKQLPIVVVLAFTTAISFLAYVSL